MEITRGRNTVQKNGIILNYYPGTLPEEVETSLRRGENMFQLTENTAQMQTENMLTMTTDGGLFSSLAVFVRHGLTTAGWIRRL